MLNILSNFRALRRNAAPIKTLAIAALSLLTLAATAVPSFGQTIASVSVKPTSVVGGIGATGTVTLSAKAPSAGYIVSLSSNQTAASVPSSVTVTSGNTSATFAIATSPIATTSVDATIKAVNGASAKSATITVLGPVLTGLSISPTAVTGPATSTGTVTLSGPPPKGGRRVALQSSSSSAVLETAVLVPEGEKTATFAISAKAVTSVTTATISAGSGGVILSKTLTIDPPPAKPKSLALSPASLTGGSTSAATVTLMEPAPTGGLKVTLSSSSKSATVPGSVVVTAGQTSAKFAVATSGVAAKTIAVITATANATSVTASLTIEPPVLLSISLMPTAVVGGSASSGTVKLSGPAPATGFVVTLKSDATYVTTAASVTVAKNATTGAFTAKTTPVTKAGSANLTASSGSVSVRAVLTVNPPVVATLAFNPAAVNAGSPSTGTITLTGPAPAGGFAVDLFSSSTVVTVPTTVTIKAGSLTGTFTANAGSVTSSTIVTITAKAAGGNAVAKLSVNTTQIVILMTGNHQFSPSSVTVAAGSTITWQNPDFVAHTVMSDTGVSGLNSDILFPNGMPSGTSFTYTIPANAKSGTVFFYHCRFHGAAGNGTVVGFGMAGSFTVK